MKKLLLTLLSSPALFASVMPMLVMANHANAAEITIDGAKNGKACVHNPHGTNLVCVRVTKTVEFASSPAQPEVKSSQSSDNQDQMLAFSDRESDMAIKLFGCDCPACIRALRGLQNLQPTT